MRRRVKRQQSKAVTFHSQAFAGKKRGKIVEFEENFIFSRFYNKQSI
jgi:hypothetical protein